MADQKNDTAPGKTDKQDPKNTEGGGENKSDEKVVQLTEAQLAKVVSEAVEKARTDEKDKLYERIKAEEEAKKAAEVAKEKAEAEAKAKEEARLALEKKLAEIAASDKTEAEKAKAVQDAMAEQIKDLQASVTQVAEDAAEKIRLSNLATYKANAIAKSGLKHLAGTVNGTTEAEIDASIQSALELEKAIYADATKALREKTKETVPGPASHGGGEGGPGGDGARGGGADLYEGLTRRELAMLPPAEYAKYRARMMEKVQKGG